VILLRRRLGEGKHPRVVPFSTVFRQLTNGDTVSEETETEREKKSLMLLLRGAD